MISRLLKTIGLFYKRALYKRLYSAKETYNFKEPFNFKECNMDAMHIQRIYTAFTSHTYMALVWLFLIYGSFECICGSFECVYGSFECTCATCMQCIYSGYTLDLHRICDSCTQGSFECIYMALLSVYMTLLSVHMALLSVNMAFLSAYRQN